MRLYLRSLRAVLLTHVIRPLGALIEGAAVDLPFEDDALSSGIFDNAADRLAERLRAELEDEATFLARMRLPRGGAS